jgi:hypothetical protein
VTQKIMPSILLIAPDASNIYQVILEGFQTFTPEVESEVMLLTTPSYRYKNKSEKIRNFLSKVFLNRNIKEVHHNQIIEKRLANLRDKYDLIFIIRPDLLNNNILSSLKSKTSNFIAYYWDSMVFFQRKKQILFFFDKVYSFDNQDCKENGFELLTNFYYYEPEPVEPDKMVFCISHLEKRRFQLFNEMGKFLEENQITFRFLTKQSKNKLKSPYIEYLEETIPYAEMLQLLNHYGVILDITKPLQNGLSFRIFESMGMNKKIITNNSSVMEYDFYNPNNILVVDFDNLSIPKTFFETSFEPIDETIKQKYHLKSFVKTIVNNIKTL